MNKYPTQRITTSYLLLTALMLLSTQVNAQPYLGKFQDYIAKEGVFPAEVNVLNFTPEMRRLTDKLQASIDRQSEWFEAYSKATPTGQPLAYHSNFGLTEKEYQEVLTGSNRQVLEPTGETQLLVAFRNDDTVRVTGLPGEEPFNGILYEPVSDSIISSYGTLQKSQAADGSLGTDNILAWSGRLWSSVQEEEGRQINVVYILGQLKNQPKNVLIHEITGIVNQQPIDYHYVLIWDK